MSKKLLLLGLILVSLSFVCRSQTSIGLVGGNGKFSDPFVLQKPLPQKFTFKDQRQWDYRFYNDEFIGLIYTLEIREPVTLLFKSTFSNTTANPSILIMDFGGFGETTEYGLSEHTLSFEGPTKLMVIVFPSVPDRGIDLGSYPDCVSAESGELTLSIKTIEEAPIPGGGPISFSYDLAGNLTEEKVTAVMKSANTIASPQFLSALNQLLEQNENNETPLKISVYPNPTSDYLNIELTDILEPFTCNVTLHNMSSRYKVYEGKKQSPSFDLNMNTYPAGVYVLNVIVGEKVISRLIIKK